MTVFRREAVAGLGRLGGRIPGSATRLKELTADVVPLCQASGVKYPKCDDRNVSEPYVPQHILCPQFAGVHLTSRTSCHPKVVEIPPLFTHCFPLGETSATYGHPDIVPSPIVRRVNCNLSVRSTFIYITFVFIFFTTIFT